jgi:hypothetical protein
MEVVVILSLSINVALPQGVDLFLAFELRNPQNIIVSCESRNPDRIFNSVFPVPRFRWVTEKVTWRIE